MDERVLHVGRVTGDDVEAALPVRLRDLGPARLVVRAVLREQRHNEGAVVGEAVVNGARLLDLDVGAPPAPARGVLPGALQVVDRRAESDPGAQQELGLLGRDALVARRLGEDAIDLDGPAARAEALHVAHDVVREVTRSRQFEDRRARVGAGDERCTDLLPPSRVTPVTRPLSTSIDSTAAPVRIVAPMPRRCARSPSR